MTKRRQPEKEWWHDFFPAFRAVFGVVPARTSAMQVRYLMKKLKLKSGSTFLDCPCGIGRISIPLAKKGIKVTGIDIVPSYLEELATKAKRGKLNINLVEADMRRIDFKEKFEAAGNLWTSFGYFEKESDNRLVLKKVFRALKPGGRFMLHMINRDWVITNFQKTDWMEIDGIKLLEDRSFDYQKSFSHERWHFVKDGREISYDTRIRMYSFHELFAMFESVGFRGVEGYSSEKDEPITRSSRMMWITGRKPD